MFCITLNEELKLLAKQHYKFIVIEKRLFSDPEVIENQKKYQLLISKVNINKQLISEIEI